MARPVVSARTAGTFPEAMAASVATTTTAAMSSMGEGYTEYCRERHVPDRSRVDWPGNRPAVSAGKHLLVADLHQADADAAAEVMSNAGFEGGARARTGRSRGQSGPNPLPRCRDWLGHEERIGVQRLDRRPLPRPSLHRYGIGQNHVVRNPPAGAT